MSLFPETLQQKLEGRVVRMSYLILLDFVSQPYRLWTGFGRIETGGYEWLGLGGLGMIDGLEQSVNGQAPETSLILSGVDAEIISSAREEFYTEARNRRAQILVQFHNEEDDQPLTLFDAPYPIWTGRMQTAQFEQKSDGTRKIVVSCESLFSLRGRPNFSMYTHNDQQRRDPGDNGFRFVSTLVNKVVRWPDF